MNTIVLDDINRNLQAAKRARKGYLTALTASKANIQKKATDKAKRELKAVEKRLAEIEKITAKLYEDNALGRITDEKYIAMSTRYESEQTTLKQKCDTLSVQIDKANEVYKNIDNFMELIDSHTKISELNARILNEFIDKIVVHEKTVNPDGSKSQRVDIYYKFIGCINMADMAA